MATSFLVTVGQQFVGSVPSREPLAAELIGMNGGGRCGGFPGFNVAGGVVGAEAGFVISVGDGSVTTRYGGVIGIGSLYGVLGGGTGLSADGIPLKCGSI